MPGTLTKPQRRVIQPDNSINAANCQEFQRQLLGEISDPATPSIVIVDMQKVQYVDSAGLMALVSGMNLAIESGKRLIICNISATVKMVFEITQLDEAFEILNGDEDIEAAIAPALTVQFA